MNGSGRNWTRRSIEELVDEFLKKKGGKPSAAGKYGMVYSATSLFGGRYFFTYLHGDEYGPHGQAGEIVWDVDPERYVYGTNRHSTPLVMSTPDGDRTALWDRGNTTTGPVTNYFAVVRDDYMDVDNLTACLHTYDMNDNDPPDRITAVDGYFWLKTWRNELHPNWNWVYSFNRGEPASDMTKTVTTGADIFQSIAWLSPTGADFGLAEIEATYIGQEGANLIDSYWGDNNTLLFVSGNPTTENIMQLRSNLFAPDAH